jgi:hypothetical protein
MSDVCVCVYSSIYLLFLHSGRSSLIFVHTCLIKNFLKTFFLCCSTGKPILNL